LTVLRAGPLLLLLLGSCGLDDGVGPAPRVEAKDLDLLTAELLRDLLRTAERDRGDAGARGQLGLAYEVNAFPGAALLAFEQAAALDPTDPRWPYHLARQRAAAGDVERALRDVDTAIRLAPGYAPAHWRRGKWLLDLGRLDEAEASFRECIRLEPDEPTGRIELARVHVQRGEPARALELLEPIAAASPGDFHVQQLLAAAWRLTGDRERAASALAGAATEKKRDRPDPWRDEGRKFRVGFAAELERAIALLENGRLAEGIEILERIRRARPDDVSLLSNLGGAYCATGRYGPGIEALEASLRVRPGHFPSLRNLIQALLATNRAPEALPWADAAVETNPTLGAAHALRADVLASLGRAEDAVASYDSAHALGARSAESLWTSGRLKGQLGLWAEAAVDLRAALALDPELGAARLLLARALAESGDVAAAREELARADAAAPGSVQVARVAERIRELAEARP